LAGGPGLREVLSNISKLVVGWATLNLYKLFAISLRLSCSVGDALLAEAYRRNNASEYHIFHPCMWGGVLADMHSRLWSRPKATQKKVVQSGCSFRPPLLIGFPEVYKVAHVPQSIRHASRHRWLTPQGFPVSALM
jgi:hypothetical protein